jgi:DNA-binding GntR family transcriptional regulator
MPVPIEVAPVRTLLRDDVHARLREAIVTEVLAPGERLRDGELAAWLGVSRTPVREALLRLQQSGLVVTRPGRATLVANLNGRAVREAQSVVAVMHGLAVREAVGQLSSDDLARMQAANHVFAEALKRGDVDAALAADDEFHEVPVAASGNQAIRSVLEQFMPMVRRLERMRFASVAGRGSVELHQKLIDRLQAGDVEGAADVSRETWQTLAPLCALLAADETAGPDDGSGGVPRQR